MQVRNARDLGLMIKDRRRRLSLSQADLASRIGTSRHWVMHVEAGKPSVELGLVLNALSALGLTCNLRTGNTLASAQARDSQRGGRPSDLPNRHASQTLSVDLSRVLARTRASGRVDEPELHEAAGCD